MNTSSTVDLDESVEANILTDAQLQSVISAYQADPEFASALELHPRVALAERSLDGIVPHLAEANSLGELLERTPTVAIGPTLDSLGLIVKSCSGPGQRDLEAGWFGAHAYVAANGVAVANGAVYHEAAAATIGGVVAAVVAVAGLVFTGAPSPSKGERTLAPSLKFVDSFREADFEALLDAANVSRARQLAMLRRAALDGDVVESTLHESGLEFRVTRYEYDSLTIETSCLVGIDEVTILECTVTPSESPALVDA